MSEQSFASQINYREKRKEYPQYRLQRREPFGASSLRVAAGTNEISTFRLPSNSVYNLSRSFLCFTATPDGAVLNRYNFLYADFFPFIQSLRVYTDSGITLINLNDVAKHTKMVWKPNIKLEDYLTYENWNHNRGLAINYLKKSGQNTTMGGVQAFIFDGTNNYDTQLGHILPGEGATPYVNIGTATFGTYTDIPNPVLDPYIGPAYTCAGVQLGSGVGSAGNPAAAARNPVVQVRFQLGMLLHTLFELDKDLPFNETLNIEITWSRPNTVYCEGSNRLNPLINREAFTGDYLLDNIRLLLALENNEEIKKFLLTQAKTEKGFKVLMDYVDQRNQAFPASTSQSDIYRITNASGQRLKKIYTSLFTIDNVNPQNEVDNSNFGATGAATRKIENFRTYLDDDPILIDPLNSVNEDDYLYLKDLLKGSVVQSSQIYNLSWVWIDDWTLPKAPLDSEEDDENYKEGLDLSTEKIYQFQAETPNRALNHISSIITQRELKFNSLGVYLDDEQRQ